MRTPTVLLAAALTACGVSETAGVAASAGAAKAKEAEQAREAPARVQGRLDESFKEAERKREAAEPR